MSRPSFFRSRLNTSRLRPQGQTRRTLLKASSVLLLSVCAAGRAGAAQILGVRVWPAPDYTRVTLENDGDLKATHQLVPNPPRLVIDIDGLELNQALRNLVAKVQPNDPYIRQVRVAQYQPRVVRLVFDLKEEIRPQVFSLAPVGNYRHRLIFDLYPMVAVDPIARLIEQGGWSSEGAGNAQAANGEPAKPPAPTLTDEPPAQAANPASPSDSAVARAGDPAPIRPEPAQTPSEPKSEPKALGKVVRMITVALDPGHGGEDPGAIGAAGTREKDVVLAIAKRLKQKLEALPNMRVLLTRDADFFVPLATRVAKARQVDADLFVSIHADAFVEPRARGSSVFVLSEKGASSAAAKWLATRENEADSIGGVNIRTQDRQLASVLLDLSTTAQIADSMRLGKAVLGEIGGMARLHKAAVEQAGFAVLKAPDIPSILIETAFITNPEEEAKLRDDTYQDKLADAITKGIRRYFSRNPPLGKSRLT